MSRTPVSTTVDGVMGVSMDLLVAALLGAANAAVSIVCHQDLRLLVRRIRMATSEQAA